MKLVNDGPGGSIIIKGKKAREMHEEEIRKKAARAKERNMAEIEAALEKERRKTTNRLRMQEEQESAWLAGGDDGDFDASSVYEVDTSGWESEDCDDVPQDSYINRSRTFQTSRPTFIYVKRVHKASYQRLMTNKHDNWAAVRDSMFLAYMAYEEESKGFQTPAFGKEALDLHACTCNGLRSYSREITLVSLDKRKYSYSSARSHTLTSSCRPFRGQTVCLFLSILYNIRACSSSSDGICGGIATKAHDRLLVIIASISPDSLESISFGDRCFFESFMDLSWAERWCVSCRRVAKGMSVAPNC